MCRLYEKLIFEYYKYHFKNLIVSVPQIKWDKSDENPIVLFPTMQTDIVLRYKKEH